MEGSAPLPLTENVTHTHLEEKESPWMKSGNCFTAVMITQFHRNWFHLDQSFLYFYFQIATLFHWRYKPLYSKPQDNRYRVFRLSYELP